MMEEDIERLTDAINELKNYPGGNIHKQGQDPKDNRLFRAMVPKWKADVERPPFQHGSSEELATQGTWRPA
jgi:hypothetical protein